MQFANVNGLTLHYSTAGAGTAPPLLFINALGTDLRLWDEVAPHFSGRRRTIRYDKRGHGLSDCPAGPYTIDDHTRDLTGLLDHLAVEQAILVGASVGGLIAQHAALIQPQRVAALVLCDTAARIGTAEFWEARIRAIVEQGLPRMAGTILGRWFAPGYAARDPAAYQGCHNLLSRMPPAGYLATCATLRDTDLRARVSEIAAPALVLCGLEDQATPPDVVRELADSLPNATFELIPGAGHTPAIERPEALVRQIGAFLEGL